MNSADWRKTRNTLVVARAGAELTEPGEVLFRSVEEAATLWILLHCDLRCTAQVRRFVDFLAGELMRLRVSRQGLWHD